jgi:hypothetical protein
VRSRICCLVLAGLAAGGCRPRPPDGPPAPPTVAFVDVNVLTMRDERILPRQTVLVRGGRIIALGPVARLPVPAGARVIEGRGGTLMPGLADMHVHLASEDELPLFVAHGVTTVRNMWGTPRVLRWREAIARGELLGPRVITGGPPVDGDPPAWPGSAIARDPAGAEQIVAQQRHAGYDFIKVYSRLTPLAYAAIAAAARRHGLRFAGHVPRALGIGGVLDAGQASIEHLEGYAEGLRRDDAQGPPPAHRFLEVDEAKVARLAQRTRRAGVWNCPTLVVTSKIVPPDEERRLAARPEARYVSRLLRAGWSLSQDRRWRGMKAADFAAHRRGEQAKGRFVRALRDAGARLLLGTDTTNPYVIPGVSALEELQLLVAAGLTPYEAIRAGTRDAAEFLGRTDLGTIAVGAQADLLLVEGDPLADVRAMTRRAGVMVRGRWLAEPELRAALARIAARHAAPRDWFAGRPPLTSGAVTRQASYEVLWRGTRVGAERLAVQQTAAGQVITVQTIDDYDHAEYLARLELDRAGQVRKLQLQSDRPEGAGELEVVRTAAGVRLTRRLASGERRVEEQQLGASVALTSDGMARFVVLVPQLRALGEEPHEREQLEVHFDQELSVRVVKLRLERVKGATGRFAVAKGWWRGTLVVDERGWPRSLENAELSFRPLGAQRPAAARPSP